MTDARFSDDYLILENDYAAVMDGAVRPWLHDRGETVTAEGFEGRPLCVRRYGPEGAPKGAVMMIHGFTESAVKFSELIYSLLRQGYAVVAWDQRGHGASWRDPKAAGDLSLTHVGRFSEYVRDAAIVYDRFVAPVKGPRFAFSHSMGGAVLGLLMEERAGLFDKAVFCAPMIAPRVAAPLSVVKALCAAEKGLGRGAARAFISKPYAGPEDFDSSCATGRARFEWYEALRAGTPMYQNNGPSYSWVLESVSVTKRLLAPGAPEKTACPVRLYTAQLDTMVDEKAQEAFARRLPRGERRVVQGAKHEIYRSQDEILFPWWHEILAWWGNEG